jgi:hypothetical protein
MTRSEGERAINTTFTRSDKTFQVPDWPPREEPVVRSRQKEIIREEFRVFLQLDRGRQI